MLNLQTRLRLLKRKAELNIFNAMAEITHTKFKRRATVRRYVETYLNT